MKSKKISSIKTSLVGAMMLLLSFSQVPAQEGTSIHLLRPLQSMMSGGSIYNIAVYLNEVRIDDLANGMLINYSLLSSGEVTLKFQKEALGSNQGAPKTVKLNVEKGSSYNYFIEATPTALNVELVEGKKLDKLKSKSSDFQATLDLKEDPGKPIVK